MVVTCGDGPHLDLLMSEGPPALAQPQFDVIRAESEGAAGYLLAQEVRNALAGRPVAWLLTQVRVDPNDAAFRHPDAAVGRVIDEEAARNLTTHFHWQFRPEGSGWRRVVPAPEPLGVVEAPTVDTLMSAGVVVICSSGGIPVVADYAGAIHGVAAVVAPELVTARLAVEIGADRLVFLTDVSDQFDTSHTPRRLLGAEELGLLDPMEGYERGAVVAAARFATQTGQQASIGPVRQARAVIDGDLGLHVVPGRRQAS